MILKFTSANSELRMLKIEKICQNWFTTERSSENIPNLRPEPLPVQVEAEDLWPSELLECKRLLKRAPPQGAGSSQTPLAIPRSRVFTPTF
jgi:hypothetical protein